MRISRVDIDIWALETEFDDLQVWYDEHGDPTKDLTDELRYKVKCSCILMIVMSKRYLASSWCKDERDWFAEIIHDRNEGRVFVVHAQQTDVADWPDFLRDERGHRMRGFEFFDQQDPRRPLGWVGLHETDEAFRKALSRLSTALTSRLRELKDRAERRAKAKDILACEFNPPFHQSQAARGRLIANGRGFILT